MPHDYAIGVNVGKYFHHACVLDAEGNQVLSKRINQDEAALRALLSTYTKDPRWQASAGMGLTDHHTLVTPSTLL